ncbi:hypothetical protein M6D81_09200 [Paenibacillus sp. J5C_2022]|uniref:hypothetical protein n=1 Tax=Paenibacillus sp. J5C2022 TaxID=2977129 RepID=UPI0021D1070F|nr:hypothetical protein [Paenibacillus sp. J5C2022]MCU6708896.1 hypothetical protein [Paenibacillus sp. J5C2022]
MQFAVSKMVITPNEPVYMAGFGNRTEKSTGVHDDIYAKAVLLVANQPLLLLTLDMLGGDRSFIHGIKETLYALFELKAEQILINFSHTHGSVYATGEHYPELRKGRYSMGNGVGIDLDIHNPDHYSEDIAYYHMLKETLVGLVRKCYEGLEEGELQLAVGTTELSVSRRLPTDNGIQWAPNFAEEIDKELTVMKLINAEGKLRGILFSHGCHPTSMNNREISAEFVGHACVCLEKQYEGATAIFLQGCGAEIKPVASVDGTVFKLCTFEEMELAGQTFALEVSDMIAHADFRTIEPSFQTKLLDVLLYTEEANIADYERELNDPDVHEVKKDILRQLIHWIQTGTAKERLPMYIAIWQLDDTTRLVALEGEISTKYSLMIKQLLRNYTTIVLGYSNGVSTYISTRKMIAEGGYEADRAPKAHKFRASFIPEIEDIIIGSIAKAEWID